MKHVFVKMRMGCWADDQMARTRADERCNCQFGVFNQSLLWGAVPEWGPRDHDVYDVCLPNENVIHIFALDLSALTKKCFYVRTSSKMYI